LVTDVAFFSPVSARVLLNAGVLLSAGIDVPACAEEKTLSLLVNTFSFLVPSLSLALSVSVPSLFLPWYGKSGKTLCFFYPTHGNGIRLKGNNVVFFLILVPERTGWDEEKILSRSCLSQI
jgi:hypothetical protein